ncbi:hypothetical protein Dda3937_00071 [Dickeya dadantii 3937]|uniref:Uncharacterized protein n=1 Tax=Dickeya dadantii (strain 3937) TaxID=198628 RepID=E0SM28_DICD3|nr:hypothetical protein Dda3937_00071 [Dickeya dadantii 3937]
MVELFIYGECNGCICYWQPGCLSVRWPSGMGRKDVQRHHRAGYGLMGIIGSENQVIIVILKANIWLSGYIYKMSGVR